MRVVLVLAAVAALAAGGAQAKATGGGDKMKACAAQWQAMKAAKTTQGSYRDFSKSCMAGGVKATTTVDAGATATAPATKVVTKTAPAPSGGVATTITKTAAGHSVTTDASGATGQCKDGSFTHATHHSGACSHHGGVAKWM